MTHDYKESLKKEQNERIKQYVAEGYCQHVSPDIISESFIVPENTPLQRQGIDKILTVFNPNRNHSYPLRIQEKFDHYKNNRICIEYFSNFERGTKGWTVKGSDAHIIAYWKIHIQTCYIFDPCFLRKFAESKHKDWLSKWFYGNKDFVVSDVKNDGYHTRVICVPVFELDPVISTTIDVYNRERLFSRFDNPSDDAIYAEMRGI